MDSKSLESIIKALISAETSEDEAGQIRLDGLKPEFLRILQLLDNSNDDVSEDEVIDAVRLMIVQQLILREMIGGNDGDAEKEDECQTEEPNWFHQQMQLQRHLKDTESTLITQARALHDQLMSSQDLGAQSQKMHQSMLFPASNTDGDKKRLNISIKQQDQSKVLTDMKSQQITKCRRDTKNSKHLITDSINLKTSVTEDLRASQTSDKSNRPDQSKGLTRTMIMAAQYETIRKTKHQINFDLATQGMSACLAVYIADNIGNASLTHMDFMTIPDLIEREIQWIKDQNTATDFQFKDNLMIHVVENRTVTERAPFGRLTSIMQMYLQSRYANIKNLKGEKCYETSNVDKGNILFVAKLDKDGVLQHKLFQPYQHHLKEQFNHCIDGCQVSDDNPLKHYYIDKGQDYRDYDFRGATRNLSVMFSIIYNEILYNAKLRYDKSQPVVVYEEKWTNQFFELPQDIRSRVRRSKGTMTLECKDVFEQLMYYYWRCEEVEKQRVLKANENRLHPQIKSQQSQVVSAQDSEAQLQTSNQSTSLAATNMESSQNALKAKKKKKASTAQQAQQSTSTLPGLKESITDIPAKADNRCNFRKKMIVLDQHEGGIIDINESNVNNISIATSGIVTCVAVIIGYRMMVTGSNYCKYPTISIMLAHVDAMTDLKFIQNRIREIKREDHDFNEQNMTIDVVKNPNYYTNVVIEEYLRDHCKNIKNSKGMPCFNIRKSNHGTVLCKGVMKNGHLDFKLYTPNEDDISHQLNYCQGLAAFTSKLFKDYFLECNIDAEIKVSIHQLNAYLLQLEHSNTNKATKFAGYPLDITYSDGQWIYNRIQLSDWCKETVMKLENYKDSDRKLRSEIKKLYQKCYRYSLHVLLPGDLELEVDECMKVLKNCWQTIVKVILREIFGVKTAENEEE